MSQDISEFSILLSTFSLVTFNFSKISECALIMIKAIFLLDTKTIEGDEDKCQKLLEAHILQKLDNSTCSEVISLKEERDSFSKLIKEK